jgi:hypothetical protein
MLYTKLSEVKSSGGSNAVICTLCDGRVESCPQPRPCVVRSFQIYEWVRSDLASHKQTRGVLCYLTLASIRIFLVMTDLPLCVRNEEDRQKIY